MSFLRIVGILKLESVEFTVAGTYNRKQGKNLIVGFRILTMGRSKYPHGLRRRSAATRLPRLWVRIPPGGHACLWVMCVVRGIGDGLIPRPEVLPTVVHCIGSRNIKNGEGMARVGPQRHKKNTLAVMLIMSVTLTRTCRRLESIKLLNVEKQYWKNSTENTYTQGSEAQTKLWHKYSWSNFQLEYCWKKPERMMHLKSLECTLLLSCENWHWHFVMHTCCNSKWKHW